MLGPDLKNEVTMMAQQMFGARAHTENLDARRRELAAVEREQARLTEAVASGADVPILVARLRATEVKRRELVAQLERARKPVQRLSWRAIENRIQETSPTGGRSS